MPNSSPFSGINRLTLIVMLAVLSFSSSVRAELKTWDGKHSIDQIEVTVIYFLPKDRAPLPDWKERVSYFCSRIERFHQREYNGQSALKTAIRPEPFLSGRTTVQLRDGDANFIFFQTLREVDEALSFGRDKKNGFPILLVLSDINWRPLDDFFRMKTTDDGKLVFEGNYSGGRHFPGAESGGARATYLADRGVGWGLVSADGWRVPYRGSDCVVYHEGVGHTVGLPHPEPGNGSVMSLAQYNGWISESWLDDDQKKRLGWKPGTPFDRKPDLFSVFTALPEPLEPKPNEPVSLKLTWPVGVQMKSCRVRFQTSLFGPWIDAATGSSRETQQPPGFVPLGRFDRATPISYRVDAVLADDREVELWGYFQVREKPDQPPLPPASDRAEAPPKNARKSTPLKLDEAVDLLALVDPDKHKVSGEWKKTDGILVSPKQYGARIELPYQPPEEYELNVIAEPLDEPNGLILGQRSGEQRFLVLVNYAQGKNAPVSAIENIDGKNVGNVSTTQRSVLSKNRLSQIVCTVRKTGVTVTCDGHELIDWQGDPKQLSLSEYWETPTKTSLFLGAYDCRYRFHRATITPLNGGDKKSR